MSEKQCKCILKTGKRAGERCESKAKQKGFCGRHTACTNVFKSPPPKPRKQSPSKPRKQSPLKPRKQSSPIKHPSPKLPKRQLRSRRQQILDKMAGKPDPPRTPIQYKPDRVRYRISAYELEDGESIEELARADGVATRTELYQAMVDGIGSGEHHYRAFYKWLENVAE